ncbi:MAG TPA: GNAT family N-acetyltransferase [Puia sp.]|uniref:GNAT family N-acetyltransferase n=1 Tax=Puia sp. TaxID=2045100 RepID=UPI002CC42EA1|nr:GNAT family N-acetyltransferase [Puia sp.]HVU96373.1 GNAT family N-acetyltransferase [Puia sp.]
MMDESLSIRPGDLDDINTIGFLAQQIWPETYGEIITTEQLQYMLNLFYSPASLRRQMLDDKHQFLIVEEGEEPIGFAAWSGTAEPGVFKLHKLYVLPGRQGKGLGRGMLQYIYQVIRPQGARTLLLNVNRWNKARQFYERMGFAVIKEEDVPIGRGYFMNDYVMEVSVPV